MKKIFPFIILAFALPSCMFSHSQGYHAYFCTTTPSHEKRFLFIDDRKVGELPYTADVPECDEMPLHKLTVYAPLSAGEHLVEIKTPGGDILFSEELEVERRKGSSSISSTVEKPGWDTKVKIKDDRLVIELVH
jgi:hypothetical protein